jgi:hypothetical protein
VSIREWFELGSKLFQEHARARARHDGVDELIDGDPIVRELVDEDRSSTVNYEIAVICLNGDSAGADECLSVARTLHRSASAPLLRRGTPGASFRLPAICSSVRELSAVLLLLFFGFGAYLRLAARE